MVQNIHALILAQDYWFALDRTIKSLQKKVGTIFMLLTNPNINKQEVLDLCDSLNIPILIKEAVFVDYSKARNELFEFADKHCDRNNIYIVIDPHEELRCDRHTLVHQSNFMINIGKQRPIGPVGVYCKMSVCSIYLKDVEESLIEKKVDLKVDEKIEDIVPEEVTNQTFYLVKLVLSHRGNESIGKAHDYLKIDTIITKNDNIEFFMNRDSKRFWDEAVDEINPRQCSILEKYHKENPEDSRTLFYLGQCYSLLKKTDKALEMFDKRASVPIEKEQFAEERFEAAYRFAVLYQFQEKNRQKVISYFLRALKIMERAEPYLGVVKYLFSYFDEETKEQRLKYFNMGHQFLKKLIELKPPQDAALFVTNTIYDKERYKIYNTLFPPKLECPDNCQICYDSAELGLILPCQHWICEDCYSTISRTSSANVCPFCRRPLNSFMKQKKDSPL